MYVSIEALQAAAGYVSREFGSYGYGLAIVAAGFMNALFELHACDGSRRLLLVDRYGNVELGPDDLEAVDDHSAWSMAAADRLHARRNGYAVGPMA